MCMTPEWENGGVAERSYTGSYYLIDGKLHSQHRMTGNLSLVCSIVMRCLQSAVPRHLQSVDPTWHLLSLPTITGRCAVVEGVSGTRDEKVLSFHFKLFTCTCLKNCRHHCVSLLLILHYCNCYYNCCYWLVRSCQHGCHVLAWALKTKAADWASERQWGVQDQTSEGKHRLRLWISDILKMWNMSQTKIRSGRLQDHSWQRGWPPVSMQSVSQRVSLLLRNSVTVATVCVGMCEGIDLTRSISNRSPITHRWDVL